MDIHNLKGEFGMKDNYLDISTRYRTSNDYKIQILQKCKETFEEIPTPLLYRLSNDSKIQNSNKTKAIISDFLKKKKMRRFFGTALKD